MTLSLSTKAFQIEAVASNATCFPSGSSVTLSGRRIASHTTVPRTPPSIGSNQKTLKWVWTTWYEVAKTQKVCGCEMAEEFVLKKAVHTKAKTSFT